VVLVLKTGAQKHDAEITQITSSLFDSLDKIEADCQLNLKWVVFSKDRLTVDGAKVMYENLYEERQ
jgi:hypothetical protein